MTKAKLIKIIDGDSFLSSYFEAALWSSTDEEGEPLDEIYTLEDFDTGSLGQMVAEMEKILGDLDVDEWIDGNYEQAGHDFWLTRNGHGAGFWDGDWPEPAASKLTKEAERLGLADLYVGDNGKLYVSFG